MKYTFVFMLLASSVASADVYKCQISGKTVFSDQPCQAGAKTIKVRPASGEADPHPENTIEPKLKSDQTAARLKRKVIESDIEQEESRLETIERDRDAELDHLRNKKTFARNNLAGATWEQSISSEMIAVTNKYESRVRIQQRKIDELKEKRDAIK